jgi:hypothetical protein
MATNHTNRYSGDSRSVGLFHYLLSGDDLLMRQAITNFASSVTPGGLTVPFPITCTANHRWISPLLDSPSMRSPPLLRRYAICPFLPAPGSMAARLLRLAHRRPGPCQRHPRGCVAVCRLGDNMGRNRRASRQRGAHLRPEIKPSHLFQHASTPSSSTKLRSLCGTSAALGTRVSMNRVLRVLCKRSRPIASTDGSSPTPQQTSPTLYPTPSTAKFSACSAAPSDRARLLTESFAEPKFSKCCT